MRVKYFVINPSFFHFIAIKYKINTMTDKKYDVGNLEFRILNPSPQQIEELTFMFTESFILLNQIWQKLNIKPKDVYGVMKKRIQSAADLGWIFALVDRDTGEIAISNISFDLVDYRANKAKVYDHYDFPWWKQISKLALQLEEEYFDSLPNKRGVTVYTELGAIKMKYATASLTEYFWLMGMRYGLSIGYKNLICRSSNPISTKLMTRLGGKIVKKVNFEDEDMKDYYMELIDTELVELNPKCIARL